METIFCLRLGLGLMACLLVLPTAHVPPRFFRVHFLTALGLTGVALAFSRDLEHPYFFWSLLVTLAVLLFGSVVWHLEQAPQGRPAIFLATICFLFTLVLLRLHVVFRQGDSEFRLLLIDDFTSAAVLGSAMTAMLIGHAYLIAPGMSMTPLLRMLKVLAASLLVRAVLAGRGLWLMTGESAMFAEPFSQTETMLWLAVRWLLGLFAPLVLGWMAWETARIRSTQSATGILYVVVIVCFLGELTSQLLLDKTGHIL